MGIRNLLCPALVAVFPYQIAETALGRYEHDAHQDVRNSELTIDRGCRRCHSRRQPPGFCNEEVGTDKCNQPDDAEQREAHPLASLFFGEFSLDNRIFQECTAGPEVYHTLT